MLLVIIFGGIGSVIRYLLAGYTSILIINIIGVFLIGFTQQIDTKYKPIFHSGFLGGFTSLSAIYLIKDFNIPTLITHFIIYIIIYKLSKFLGGFYV